MGASQSQRLFRQSLLVFFLLLWGSDLFALTFNCDGDSSTPTQIDASDTGTYNSGVDLTLANGVSGYCEVINGTLNVNNLVIDSGVTLTHPSTTSSTIYTLEIVAAGDVTISSGATIDVSQKGFLGGMSGDNATTTGMTYDSGSPSTPTTTGGATGSSTKSSGGSHGGLGYAYNGANRPVTFDSVTDPALPGSGGSAGISNYAGGNGGGVLRITAASGTIMISGNVYANGENGHGSYTGYCSGAGGAGGTIFLSSTNLSGAGPVQALGGGRQGTGQGCEGVGGGGRVAIIVTGTDSYSGEVNIYGNNGYQTYDAQSGTYYHHNASATYGTLTLEHHPSSDSSVTTTLSDSNYQYDEVIVRKNAQIVLSGSSTFTVGTLTITADNGSPSFTVNSGADVSAITAISVSSTAGNASLTFGAGADLSSVTSFTMAGSSTYRSTITVPDAATFAPTTMNVSYGTVTLGTGNTFSSDVVNLDIGTNGTMSMSSDMTYSDMGDSDKLHMNGGTLTMESGTTLSLTNMTSTVGKSGTLSIAGTLYVNQTDITLDDGGDGSFTLELGDGNFKKDASTNFTNLTIASGVTLGQIATTTTTINRLVITVLGDIDIQSGASINVDGKGFLGAYKGSNSSTIGMTLDTTMTAPTTTGGATRSLSGTSGGSHGGKGGVAGGGITNSPYGDVKAPIFPGAGGNSYSSSFYGGTGGGVIQLTASSGSITINGDLSADGSLGYKNTCCSYGGGAGAGGSIYLVADTITGSTGTITANGTSHGTSQNLSAASGGGRIALVSSTADSFSGTMTATTPNTYGAFDAGAGTIFRRVTGSQDFGDLVVDNGSLHTLNTVYTYLTRTYHDGGWLPPTSVQEYDSITVQNEAILMVDNSSNNEQICSTSVTEDSGDVADPNIIDSDRSSAYSINICTPLAPTTLRTHSSTTASGDTNPIDLTSLTPVFSAQCNSLGGNCTDYEIEVDDDSDFTSTVWDSGAVSMSEVSDGNRMSDVTYAGSQLVYNTTYYWRIRFSNANGVGDWSSSGTFSAERSIELVNFNEGGAVQQGSDVTVQWMSYGGESNETVKLEYSTDDFSSDINTINASVSSLSSTTTIRTASWTIPAISSSSVKIRVSSNNDGNNYTVTSANNFTIQAALVSSGSGIKTGLSFSNSNFYTSDSGVTFSSGSASFAVTDWYDINWTKKKSITIDNSSGSTLSNHPVRLVVQYDADMKADFTDLRFTDSDGATELSYVIEKVDTSPDPDEAIVWVKVPSLAIGTSNTIYMYYGNASASDAGDGESVFLFFDDFNDNSIDTSKWNVVATTGTVTETSQHLELVGGNGWGTSLVYAKTGFNRDGDYIFEYEWTSGTTAYYTITGWKDSAASVGFANWVYAYDTTPDDVIYEDGSSRGSGAASNFSTSSTYLMQVVMKASGGAIYKTSANDGDTWTTSYTSSYSTEANLRPALMSYYSTNTQTYDNIRVRPYVATEPTVSAWGSEEAQPSSSTKTVVMNTGHSFGNIKSFSANVTELGSGMVRFQVSDDDGVTWYYCSGSTLTVQSSGITDANTAAELTDTCLGTLHADGGTFKVKVYMQAGVGDTASIADMSWVIGTTGALSSTNVQPDSLVAGAVGGVSVSFDTQNDLPSDGKIKITFPSGFTTTGASSASCSSMDGSFAISEASNVVTITRSGGSNQIGGGSETCTFTGIQNPTVSGSTGTYIIETSNSADTVIDTASVTADTILPGSLSSTNVEPASLIEAIDGNITISFTIANPWPATGKLVIDLPSGFDASGATVSSENITGSFNSPSISSGDGTNDVITLTRDGTGSITSASSAVTITLASVKNPTSAGSTGTYSLTTQNASAVAIDQDAAVSADTITEPSVSFTSSSQSSAGETSTMTITAQLSSASGNDVDIPFTVNASSTATGSGTDYSISSSPITITAGSTTADITITISADTLDEENETVIVNMGTPTNASQGAVTTHTATITDDDAAPTVIWTTSSQGSAGETGTMTITAQLSATSGKNVTVPFSIGAGSTATGSGTDYSISSSPLSITAGSSSADITITIVSDTLDEHDETVIVTMGTPTNASQGATTTHTATITDDDASPSVSFTSSSQTSSGESGTMTITAQLSAVSGRDVSVPFSVNGSSTATGSGTDYSISSSPLSITAGSSSADITITIVSDSLDEADETVIVDMGSPTNASQGATTSHTATIQDDDGAPTVYFGSASSSGSESTTSVTIPVQISNESGQDVTFSYSVSGGDAQGSGTDYTLSGSSGTITAGNTSTNISVTINNDTDDEDPERFILTLSSPTNASLGTTTVHTYVILDDDATSDALNIQESNGGTYVQESSETLSRSNSDTILVSLKTAPSDDVTVTATPQSDISVYPNSFTFTSSNWNKAQTLTVQAIDDEDSDGNTTQTIDFASSSDDTSYNGLTEQVTVNLIDDDQAGIKITENFGIVSVREGSGTATYSVVLTSAPGDDVTVTVGNDTQVTDSGDLTFTSSDWDSPQTVTITASNDSDAESNHTSTITHTLSSNDSAYHGLSAASVLTNIVDNNEAGVFISQDSELNITEGDDDTITVVLTKAPSSDVTVTPRHDAQLSVEPSSLTFTSGDFSTPQTLTITAVSDSRDEQAKAFSTMQFDLSSSDLTYNALKSRDLSVLVTDNDTAGVTVSSVSGNTGEDGTTANFTVVLNTQPAANVTIPLTSSDTSEGIVSPSSLTFTSNNWNTAQTVTVTGVDDSEDDDDVTYTIVLGAASSSDTNYHHYDPNDVSLLNEDNEDLAVHLASQLIMRFGQSREKGAQVLGSGDLTYSWTAGSGSCAVLDQTDQSRVLIYASSQVYCTDTLTLTVNSPEGQSESDTMTLIVLPASPRSNDLAVEVVGAAGSNPVTRTTSVNENGVEESTLHIGETQLTLECNDLEFFIFDDDRILVVDNCTNIVYVSAVPMNELGSSENLSLPLAKQIASEKYLGQKAIMNKAIGVNSNFYSIAPAKSTDQLGRYVAACDIDGDGESEICISAPGAGDYGILYIYTRDTTLYSVIFGSEADPIHSVISPNVLSGIGSDPVLGPDNLSINSSLKFISEEPVARPNLSGLWGNSNLEGTRYLSDGVDLSFDAGEEYLSVSSGDLNGDGETDLVSLLANGLIQVHYGPHTLNADYGPSDVDLTLSGFEGADCLPESLALGDTNGDGFADLVVGVPCYGSGREGALFVFMGASSFEESSYDLINSEEVLSMIGDAPENQIGSDILLMDSDADGAVEIYTVKSNGVVTQYNMVQAGELSSPDNNIFAGGGCTLQKARKVLAKKWLLAFFVVFIFGAFLTWLLVFLGYRFLWKAQGHLVKKKQMKWLQDAESKFDDE